MLYDKRWDAKPAKKPDVFSLESLIAWLETMPGDEEYDYCQPGNCLVAQYLVQAGEENYSLLPSQLREHGWYLIANAPGQHTFGAALTRARKALADQSHSHLCDETLRGA